MLTCHFETKSMRHSVLTILLLLLPQVSACGADQTLQKWAVMATEEVVASGLTDLLTVSLSQHEFVQLVERERLEAAMQELELSSLVRADRVGERLRLGRILKANALMVLSFEETQEKRRLQVVVCDADLGVRLWDGHFVFTDDKDVEQLARHCAAVVDEVRQRFAGGIQHIIAVPTFLSEDFEHDFDYLQSHCSNLVRNSLKAHAGVTVVEIEEARAILQELENTLSSGLDRPASSVVRATYRVADSSGSNSEHRVHLKIDLLHGNEQEEQIEKPLAIDALGPWLVQEFTKQLLSVSRKQLPVLSPESQIEILVRHAQRFAELGNWEQSISLREAALVLDPNNAMQRALLISEYQHRFLKAINANWAKAKFAKPLPPETRERELQLAAHDYCVGLDHLAYLVRSRLIHRVDAIGMLGRHTWYKPPYTIGAALPRDPLKFEALQAACVAQREFLRDVYPLAMKLPDGRLLPKHLSEPFYGAQYVVTNHVVSDVGFNGFNSESLESLRELLTYHLSADARTWSSVLGLLGYTYVPRPGDDSYSDWIDLLTELSKSDRELARLYGRYALALDQKHRTKSCDGLEQLLVEVRQSGRTDEPIYNVLNLRLMRPRPQSSLKPTAPIPRGHFGPLGRMHLEPVSLSVDSSDANGRPPQIIGMLQCGDVDAYWSKDRFFVMHEPGVLRELKLTNLTAEHMLFWGVAWDGEFIWLQAYGRGIVAVRPDGTGLTSFKGRTPGYGKGHKLMGLSPGRALMVGSFGQNNRAWCGLLKIDAVGQSSVNVFFEAKTVTEGRTATQAAADVTTVFQPEDLSRVRHSDGREFVLVDRRDLSLMLVDLETLDVSIPEKGVGLKKLSTQSEPGYFGRLFLRDGDPIRVTSGVAISRNSKRVLFHDGWLYRPGYVWMRQHVDSRKLERLQAKTLPHEYWDLQVGSSAHYGLITYSPSNGRQPVSRVTVLAETNSQARQDQGIRP